MVTELAGIIEACFSVPVPVAPFALVVGNGPGYVLLAEDFLSVYDGGHIGKTCTEAVLAALLCGIIGVVGCLYLEIQALGDESEVQFILDIEVEDVGALVRVSELIIIGKGVTVERTYDILVRYDMAAIFVNAASGVRSCTLQVTEKEALTATHGVAVLHATAQGE